jgi:GAF domain-containing protein
MDSDRKGRVKSDRPRPELKKERDAFIETFFKKGVQFTEDLINENRVLRTHIADLEADNANLRAQLASDEAIRELLKKIDGLEAEKNTLLSRYQQAQAISSKYHDRFSEIEAELANLANLYIASFQLHASLTLARTVRHIKEVLEQLVGARAVAIYLADPKGEKLIPIASFGLGLGDLGPAEVMDGGVLSQVYVTSTPHVEEGELAGGSREKPVAVIPLKVDGRIIGVLAVVSTFEHKPRFLPVDFELFKLLGEHAGRALVCARLFEDAERKLPDLEGYLAFDL